MGLVEAARRARNIRRAQHRVPFHSQWLPPGARRVRYSAQEPTPTSIGDHVERAWSHYQYDPEDRREDLEVHVLAREPVSNEEHAWAAWWVRVGAEDDAAKRPYPWARMQCDLPGTVSDVLAVALGEEEG